ncbi:MAG: UvrD-helicase domain-containing protein [Deltaproteobacteria bacterium]|nr:UvrD-helicase domain-containing protein [Deltaproteobacteria bacterium]
MNQLLKSLNSVQREAVLRTAGPLVIFAGAGSGKTRIITTRIAWLIEQGVYPWQILAVTFTNKASREMKERLCQLSPDSRSVHIGTFHSACARWLREFAEYLGFSKDFTIYDEKDAQSALRRVMEQLRVDQGAAVSEYRYAISKAKVRGWLPADLKREVAVQPDRYPPMAGDVYHAYQEYLAQCHAMDFNDLLLNMVLLLRRNHEVKERLRKRYRYIMIDEYQDTNPAQFALISELVSEDQNLCVVGDDDQSIYSWRGADPGNILTFRQQYPTAHEIRLEQNYRCSNTIIQAAASLIRNNRTRVDKQLWTENPSGELISEDEYYDGELEAAMIAENIRKEQKLYPFAQTAVFYRTNAQSRLFEENLRRQNIPYRIYGALRFYDRAEIRDILAWIRLMVNPGDDLAFQRAIVTPPRGIGATTLVLIKDQALKEGSSLLDSLRMLAAQPELPRVTKKLQAFLGDFDKLRQDCLGASPDDVIGLILTGTGYHKWQQKKDPEQAKDRLANIHELSVAISSYYEAFPETSLAEWLRDLALAGSEEESDGGVSLMTLHSAKGLEFDRVYIAGVEDKLLPHVNSMEDSKALEEERRLLYVGMTRAKQKLSLSYARRRRIFNQWVAHRPSRFLREIPSSLIRSASPSAPVISASSGRQTTAFATGAYVSHPTFGKGKIEALENGDRYMKALVCFSEFGKRMVPVHHLKGISSL